MAKMCGTLVRCCLSTGIVAARVNRDAGALGADVTAVGAAPDRQQHAIEHLLLRLHLALERGEQSFGPGFEFRHLGIEIDRLVAFLDALGERADEVAVGARNEPVGQFHHRDLGAERVVDAGHLQADDAAADHQQAPRDVGQLQRPGRVHQARIVVGKPRNPGHAGARGNNAGVERNALYALGCFHRDLVGRLEFPHALQRGHFALFGQGCQTLGQPADDRVLPAAQLVDFDLRLAEFDAGARHLFGLRHHLGRMQQRLGRNAADVEADAAERRIALDQHDFLAQVGGAEGGGIAAGAGAQHHDFGVQVGAARCGSGCWR